MDIKTSARRLYLQHFARWRLAVEGPFNFYLLDEDPHIILTFTPSGLGHVAAMAARMAPRPCHFLVGFWWDMERKERVDHFQITYRKLKRKHPHMHLVVLCNSTGELQMFRQRTDIPCHLVNHNCFLDERVYRVREEVAKEFDALYNARMGAYKRLELAEAVRSLALITSPFPAHEPLENDYYHGIRRRLSHAHWLNFNGNRQYERIPVTQICEQINRARTGLILSATEGACYSAGEYLLCGLPVVSTQSKGGRDELFTDATALLVPPEPQAVADGVRHWITAGYDPHRIRETTLALVWQHRRTFFGIVDAIRKASGKARPMEEDWPCIHRNKMNYKCDPEAFEQLLDGGRFWEAVGARPQPH